MAVAGHAEGRRRVERGRKGTRRVDAHVSCSSEPCEKTRPMPRSLATAGSSGLDISAGSLPASTRGSRSGSE